MRRVAQGAFAAALLFSTLALAGNSGNSPPRPSGGGGGGSGAPTDATYITQTANGSLSAEQALGALSSGPMYSTTTTGVVTTLTTLTGLTVTSSAMTVDLSTGKAGGQTLIGGTLTTQGLTVRPNAADTTTGRTTFQGLGISVPAGTVSNPSINFGTTGTGLYGVTTTAVEVAVSGARAFYVDATGVTTLSNADVSGYYLGSAGQAGVLKDGATTGLKLYAGGSVRGYIKSTGSWVTGTATLNPGSATDGYFYMVGCSGTFSATPTSQTGTVAMCWDSTNHKLMVYSGGWKGATTPGAFN